MIYYLFPSAVYLDKNVSMIKHGKNLFNKWKRQPLDYTQPNFATTLSDYDPSNALLSEDFINTDDGQKIVEYIKESVYKFLEENQQSTNYDVDVVNLWLNEMTSGSVHLKHNHFGYTLSGSFYVETPEPSNKIEFYSMADDIGVQKILNVEKYTPMNSSSWWIPIEPGVICLFPAYLKHAVPQEEFDGVRQSIAFDITLKLRR